MTIENLDGDRVAVSPEAMTDYIKARNMKPIDDIDQRFPAAHYEHDLQVSPQLPVAEQPAGQAVDAKEWLRQESSVYALNERGVNSDYINVQQADNRHDRAATNDLAERIRMLLSRPHSPVAQMSGYATLKDAQIAMDCLRNDPSISGNYHLATIESFLASHPSNAAGQSAPTTMREWQDKYLPQSAAQERMENDPATEIANKTLDVFHVGTPSPMPTDAAMSMLEQGLKPARDGVSKSPVMRGDYEGQWTGGFGNMPEKKKPSGCNDIGACGCKTPCDQPAATVPQVVQAPSLTDDERRALEKVKWSADNLCNIVHFSASDIKALAAMSDRLAAPQPVAASPSIVPSDEQIKFVAKHARVDNVFGTAVATIEFHLPEHLTIHEGGGDAFIQMINAALTTASNAGEADKSEVQ